MNTHNILYGIETHKVIRLSPTLTNGREVWRSLGDAPVNTYDQQLQAAQQKLADSSNRALASAQKIIGNTSGLSTETGVGKVTKFMIQTGSVVAPIAAVFVPIGTIIAAVCGIVMAVAGVVGKIWGQNPDKAINAMALKYTEANGQLQQQILQINNQFYQMLQALEQIHQPLAEYGYISNSSAKGLASIIQNLKSTVASMGLSGLGSTAAQSQLDSDVNTYKMLRTQLNDKSAALMDLMTEFNNIMNETIQTYNRRKNEPKYILFGGLALLASGLVWYSFLDETEKNPNNGKDR